MQPRISGLEEKNETKNIKKIKTLAAEAGDVGKRLDIFLAERLEMTRSASQKLIDGGNTVLSSGRKAAKSILLSEGETVTVEIPEPKVLDAAPEDIPLDIVYEDGDVIVVNKPKGMVVHPAAGNYKGTLVNALMHHCGDSLSAINGVVRPGIVHRIDKDTSGLLVCAKNDRAHISLAEQLKEHSMERAYHALVCGRLKNDSGRIEAPIGRNPKDRKKMAVVPDGREAATNYEVLERFEGFTYVRLVLESGRTHQIRVHMSSVGHPVAGDVLYGGGRSRFEKLNEKILSGQCLHAKTLGFDHPTTGERMRFDSVLPDYFTAILDKLRNKERL
ncbi:MAG: RluA family pseudouridine synthase [Clostridia bacterium]|nr:RluA family pseudouridine synthase [Clostridia bacterium]